MSNESVPSNEELPSAFFSEESGTFHATTATRGPWSDTHQHGGPPAALLARAIEKRLAAEARDARVARLSVVFHKPLPIGAFHLKVEDVRSGKKVKLTRACLFSANDPRPDGKPSATADALVIRRAPVEAHGPAMQPERDGNPRPDACDPYRFEFFRSTVGYHVAMELRRMHGRFGDGRMGLWFRMRVPLLANETPSPLQRLMCAADSGNGVSVGVDLAGSTFVNPDVTAAVLREPIGEWIGVDARTSFADDGIGLADARLLDEHGVVGRALQPLILEAR